MAKKLDKPFNKTELLGALADDTGLSKKEVGAVFDSLLDVMKRHLNGPGIFVLPGLLKVLLIKKPAVKARKGINPFTKEEVMFKAKPARKVVKIKALKKLKDVV